jgi:hypothetical protein
MNINGGVSYTCAAGDRVYVVKDDDDVIRVSVTKQDGTSVVAAGGGSLILLETVTASGASTIDIENTFDSTYDAYEIVLAGIIPGTDGRSINIRLKVGGSYLTAGYAYHLSWPGSNSTAYNGSAHPSTDEVPLGEAVGNAAGESGNFRVQVYNPTSTSIKHTVNWSGGWIASNGYLRSGSGACFQDTTGALTGVQIWPYDGTISGTARLYGLVNS